MKCKKCGMMVQDGVTTCPNCGDVLNDQLIDSVIKSEGNFQVKKFAAVSFGVMIGALLIYSIFFTMNITVVGKWRCAAYEKDIDVSKELNYIFEMEFNKDGSFRYDTYDTASKDFHMVGNYSVEDNSKANDSNYLGVQNVYYIPTTIIQNGEKSVSKNTSNFEFDFIEKNIVLLIDTKNSYSYVCKK